MANTHGRLPCRPWHRLEVLIPQARQPGPSRGSSGQDRETPAPLRAERVDVVEDDDRVTKELLALAEKPRQRFPVVDDDEGERCIVTKQVLTARYA